MNELTIKQLKEIIESYGGDVKVKVTLPNGGVKSLIACIGALERNGVDNVAIEVKPAVEEAEDGENEDVADKEWFAASWHYQIADRLLLYHCFKKVVDEEGRLCICRTTPVGNIYVSNYIVDDLDCIANYVFTGYEGYEKLVQEKAGRERIHIYDDDALCADKLINYGEMYQNLYENIISMAYSADSVLMK